ncbi:MerR family transcriptional regulator [Clostridium sp.]|uniref:MerR family transcriptional regulator n=1 Tax=Clostridium sp. TaxID=1506 RepID=UPI002FC9BE2B
MLINEACKECSLTKKAIEYYERQGLVTPKVRENGYRDFNDKDIFRLKEISVLRRLGLSIDDIKDVLSSSNKSTTLSKYKYLMDLKIEKAIMRQKYLENLIANYDINGEIKYIDSDINSLLTIKEKLVQAFPGTYGMYLAIHFGEFLNERIDSKEKEEAYSKIINFLDSTSNISISEELEEYLEEYFTIIERADIENINSHMLSAVEDIDNYISKNKESLEKYIEIRTSEEFKASPAYKFQQLLLDFQQSNGYYDIFILNLKILSPSYREYVDKLEEANKLFIEKYPQMANLYEKD